MRLASAFRRLVAVESFTEDRAPEAPPAAPSPDAGARWGQPSEFQIGETPKPPALGSITASWVHELRRFTGAESHRQYGSTPTPKAGSAEAIRSITFYLGEREVRRERRRIEGRVTTVEPVIETIREYVRLDFPVGLEGQRGEPAPPETPPREEPDYG